MITLLKQAAENASTPNQKRFKAFFGVGISSLIFLIIAPFFLLIKAKRDLNFIYDNVLPLIKELGNLKQNANSLNSEMQTFLLFDEINENSLMIFELETKRLQQTISKLENTKSFKETKHNFPSLDRGAIFSVERTIINLVKEKKLEQARNLYFDESFIAQNKIYLSNILKAYSLLNDELAIFQKNQNDIYDLGIKLLILAFGISSIIWFKLYHLFKTIQHDEVQTKKELDAQRVRSLNAKKMADLGKLAGEIAHEVNNPLTIIKANNGLILKSQDDGIIRVDSIEKYIQKVDATVDRISKIIRSLKRFAHDGSRDQKELTSLSSIFQNAFDLCQEKFKNNQVKLIIDCQQDVLINCRTIELEQVLINMATNSLDAIVTNEYSQDRYFKIKTQIESENLILYISDSGDGINDDLKEKVFEPFFTTKEAGHGTGLGIPICKKILIEHEGDLQLWESPTGIFFKIKLPIAEVVQLKSAS